MTFVMNVALEFLDLSPKAALIESLPSYMVEGRHSRQHRKKCSP